MPSTSGNEDVLFVPSGGKEKSRDRHTSSVTDKSEKSSSSDSSDLTVALPPPPDGGWGWVIVAGSFVAHMIADGCAYSFGVLYEELLDYFDESKAKTALLGSLFLSIPLMTGPIAGALTDRFGCRAVTIAGGLLSGLGFVASSFATSIDMLCVTMGIIAGFGLSMVYVPAIVIVAFYFEKRRAFATGIAVAGTGIGTFIFAPLMKGLIKAYGWNGSLLIIGGLLFNIVICGLVFRPLVYPKLDKKQRKYAENLAKFSQANSSASISAAVDTGYNSKESRFHEVKEMNVAAASLDDLMSQPVTTSLINFPTFVQEELNTQYPDLLHGLEKENKTLREVLEERGVLEQFYAYHSSLGNLHESATNNSELVIPDNLDVSTEMSEALTGTISDSASPATHLQKCSKRRNLKNLASTQNRAIRRPPCYHGYVINRTGATANYRLLPMYRKDVFYRGNLMRPGLLSRRPKTVSCPNINIESGFKPSVSEESSSDDDDEYCSKPNKAVKNIRHGVRRMLHLGILKSPTVLFFCLSSFLLYFSYDVPYIFITDQAIMLNYEEGLASFLVSIIGITSTVGQILLGWLGDHPCVNTVYLYSVLTTAAGVLTCAVPVLASYWSLAVYCSCFGFLISANYALTTIILVDLLGMAKLTNAYGVVMFAEGVGNLLGPPIAGWIADRGRPGQEYKWAFISAGIIIAVSGAMLFALPCIKRRDKAAQKWSYENDDESEISNSEECGKNINSNNKFIDKFHEEDCDFCEYD